MKVDKEWRNTSSKENLHQMESDQLVLNSKDMDSNQSVLCMYFFQNCLYYLFSFFLLYFVSAAQVSLNAFVENQLLLVKFSTFTNLDCFSIFLFDILLKFTKT